MSTLARIALSTTSQGRDSPEIFTPSAYAIANATSDNLLFELAEQLNAASHAFHAAAAELAIAERKLQRVNFSAGQDLPRWFCAREEAEAAARTFVESLHEKIVQTGAFTRAGLAIKLTILAALYRDDPTLLGNDLELDGTEALLRSIIDDLPDHSKRQRG